MKGHSKHSGGFTLIETTIAMVVMMVVGLGATSLFLYAIRNNSGGEERSQALAIAQQRLEELREAPYNDPQLAVGQTTATVVLHDIEAGSGTAAAAAPAGYGSQAYTASSSGSDFLTPSKPGKGTPTPTPTTGGGTGGTGGGSNDTYQVVTNVAGLPAGSATPTRKHITITVTPVNGYGTASWINQNPVTIILHRSSPTAGPYRQ
ncbi:MAG TPA: prepilin-type N-terminal cleavage/methylation domain-containing protein [Pyrinomonadaceae bacterium]|nr:prepilin-type N-terminal cleavage/methylation domain-containing protein [Pyrinomonadaceae bacterium]